MSDASGYTQHRDGFFEMARNENGKTVIYRTDSETDFIRYHVENLIEEQELTGNVSALVSDAGSGWTRVEIVYAPDDAVPDERVMDSLMDFDSILQSAFSASGKGFYECREEIRESDRQWWVVRHHHGPWM